ncbi:MAG: IS1182 family transposase, partial [Thermomicrobiales bacterium]
LVRDAYAPSGRPSIDPVVFFKLQLVLFFEGLRSERQLMEVVGDRLRLRWYLGDDLTEPLPDHSSLSRIRERYGLAIFHRFFETIVEQCLAAGLVWGQECYIEAPKVAANAALASRHPRFAVAAPRAHLFAAEDDHADEGGSGGQDEAEEDDAPARWPVVLSEAAQADVAARALARHDGIGQAGRPDRSATSGTSRRTADFRVSATDPDATPMPYGEGGTRLGSPDHDVVDGGRARIILTAVVAPAEVQETHPALDLLWRVRFRWKRRPRQVTGDPTYGTIENIVAIEGQGIRASVPVSEAAHRSGLFRDTDFVSDAAADADRCPAGQPLRFLTRCHPTRRRLDAAPAGVCRPCALRDQCTTAQRGRRLGRHRDEDSLERVRAYHATEPYARAMRKRKVWVEPLFAEAKDGHGLRRFRLRGLEQVNGEALLLAAGQNLKRLRSRWGWGRRPFPSGAAGVVLPALPLLPVPTP